MPARGQRIVIIAGPNGAGKTTFAQEFLSSRATRPTFINADLIAAGLSPFNPGAAAIRAGRLMLEEIHRHVAARESFAFETTLAGHGYVPMMRQWQAMGYRVELIFLKLDRPEHLSRCGACETRRPRRSGIDDPATLRVWPAEFFLALRTIGGCLGTVRQFRA